LDVLFVVKRGVLRLIVVSLSRGSEVGVSVDVRAVADLLADDGDKERVVVSTVSVDSSAVALIVPVEDDA